MPDKDKITTENIGEFAKSVGLPVLGAVPHDDDLEALRLSALSAGADPKMPDDLLQELPSLRDEFMRPGALEIKGFVDTQNPVLPSLEDKLTYDLFDTGIVLRRGDEAIALTFEEIKMLGGIK